MLNTLTLLTALLAGAAEVDDLTLSNARLTFGVCGPTRPSARVLPGDSLVVSFDITGITADENGKVRYSISTELSDEKGKVIFRQPAREQDVTASLGGGKLPAFAQVDVGLEQPAGEHSLKVVVTDLATKKHASLTQPFTILPRGFGMVRFNVSRDPDGQLPTLLPIAGDAAWIHLAVVGFERAKPEGQPNVVLEVRILDDKFKPTVLKPTVGTVDKDVPAAAASLPLQFPVTLNRAGKFTLQLRVIDKVSGKNVEYSSAFTVHPAR